MVSNSHSILILFLVCFLFHYSCTRDNSTIESLSGTPSVPVEILVEIGSEDQSFEYQLGMPHGVVTDTLGNIYIADRASLTVKIFGPDGVYLGDFGGRGRGPGEFQGINLMSYTDDDQLLFLDRGKLEFIYLSLKGEFISSFFVDISSQEAQYYPKSLKWVDNNSIGLVLKSSFPTAYLPPLERPLFYIYDNNFQQRKKTFFPFSQLGYNSEEMFIWTTFIYYPGSFNLSSDKKKIIYAPAVYEGKLYEFNRNGNGWELNRIINGMAPKTNVFEIYSSDMEYEANSDLPGTAKIYYGGGVYMGRINSFDGGIFYTENGNIIHFFGEWSNEKITLDDGNDFNLNVQILNNKGELVQAGSLLSIERSSSPPLPLVNWKDKEDNFYLLNLSEKDVPTVIKFRLDIDAI